MKNTMQEIKLTRNYIARTAGVTAKRWQDLKAKDCTWEYRHAQVARSVEWAALKLVRKMLEVCGERARKGYLILGGEAWVIKHNPCGFWIECKGRLIVLYYEGRHLASPMKG